MQNHISTIMGRYKGKCTHWDVVNEGMSPPFPLRLHTRPLTRQPALNEDGTYRDNVFLRVIGEAYLPISFRMAAAADSSAKLYYNDYNLEYGEAKTLGAVKIVKLVQSYGIKIDGVGLQGHMVSESTSTQSTPCPSRAALGKALKMFTDLNVTVAYTEVDVRMRTPSNAAKLQAQARAYGDMMGACIDNPRCVGFTVWGVSDKYSWVPQTFNGVSIPGGDDLDVFSVADYVVFRKEMPCCGAPATRRSLRILRFSTLLTLGLRTPLRPREADSCVVQLVESWEVAVHLDTGDGRHSLYKIGRPLTLVLYLSSRPCKNRDKNWHGIRKSVVEMFLSSREP